MVGGELGVLYCGEYIVGGFAVEDNVKDKDAKKVQRVGKHVPFQRIRRITGYLVGTLDRFCNAKRAEEKDRVKHDDVKGK